MPPVARLGDADFPHCGPKPPIRMQGSPNVFVNFRPVSRQGDLNSPHLKPCGTKCCPHTAGIALGSTRVFANFRGVGRLGDYIVGCTKVAQGSPNVFAGG
jgi:uncharacterized Zn-binding protein involved in type VI secretion